MGEIVTALAASVAEGRCAYALAYEALLGALGAPSFSTPCTTERVSAPSFPIRSKGSWGRPVVGGDGGHVFFWASFDPKAVSFGGETNGGLFARDRATRDTRRLVEGYGVFFLYPSTVPGPAVTPDGRFVAFVSGESHGTDDANVCSYYSCDRTTCWTTYYNCADVFVLDVESGVLDLASVASDGTQGDADVAPLQPAVSDDGRFVAFASYATNVVQDDAGAGVFVRDRLLGATERVNLAHDGSPVTFSSGTPAINADGRYVAFRSRASDVASEDALLCEGGASHCLDLYVRDRVVAATERISVATDGGPGNGDSSGDGSAPGFGAYDAGAPSMSADGRYVAFSSLASNLVPEDANGVSDVFVRDRETGTTELVSRAPDGAQWPSPSREPSISADGRLIAYALYSADYRRRFGYVHDRVEGVTRRADAVEEPDEVASAPLISADGGAIAYLVYENGPYGPYGPVSVRVRDLVAEGDERVDVATDGLGGGGGKPRIGPDGRLVFFSASSPNLVDDDETGKEYVRDRLTGVLARASKGDEDTAPDWACCIASFSADGRFEVFQKRLGGGVYLRDRSSGDEERVDLAPDGSAPDDSAYDPSISADGRFVAFVTRASNLVAGDGNGLADVFVHDRADGSTERVSVAWNGAETVFGAEDTPTPVMNADGRFVAFSSSSRDFMPTPVPFAQNVYVRDRELGATELISGSADGAFADDASGIGGVAISADGRFVAFDSDASNLASDDDNGARDIFVHDRETGDTERVSVASDGGEGEGWSGAFAMNPTGRFFAFQSSAENLVPGDTNAAEDIFLRDRGFPVP